MDFRGKTILVIDHAIASRTLLCQLLSQAGYSHVLAADSAQQAFDLLATLQENNDSSTAPVDLIIQNLVETDMDGVATCSKLKALPQTTDIPIIMVAASNDANLENAFEQGALDYVSTPITRTELSVRVKAALSLKDLIDTRIQLTAQLAEANERLHRAALTDGLTGLANRSFFNEFLEKEWRRCRREQQNITLCLIDIDCFRTYNYSYGHPQGDVCLTKIATILVTNVKRPGDLVARLSGHQFAIVLSGTSDSGGCTVAKRVMKSVAAHNIPHDSSTVSDRITLSFGIAVLVPKATTTVYDLMAQAENALYEAQTMGRNRISCPCLKGHPQP